MYNELNSSTLNRTFNLSTIFVSPGMSTRRKTGRLPLNGITFHMAGFPLFFQADYLD